VYVREYPQGTSAAHVLGYYSIRYGRAGIEAAANEALSGKRDFATFADMIEAAAGTPVAGSDVRLTIDSRVQAAAETALGDRRGACVAIDPTTGAVLAYASNPAYTPAAIDEEWERLSADDNGAPLLDRAGSSLYPPGSTFKIVTLSAALESGMASLDTTYTGPARLDIGGARRRRAPSTRCSVNSPETSARTRSWTSARSSASAPTCRSTFRWPSRSCPTRRR
jgi:peptidoglycan glycosyltransferase